MKNNKLCESCGNGKFNKLRSSKFCKECGLLKYNMNSEVKAMARRWSRKHSEMLGIEVIVKMTFNLKVEEVNPNERQATSCG